METIKSNIRCPLKNTLATRQLCTDVDTVCMNIYIYIIIFIYLYYICVYIFIYLFIYLLFTHIYDHMCILFSGHQRSYTQEIIVIGQYSGRTTFQMGHAATQVSALERDGTKVQHNSLRGPAVSDCTVTFKGWYWLHSVNLKTAPGFEVLDENWRNSLEPCLGEPVVLLFRPQILQVLEGPSQKS